MSRGSREVRVKPWDPRVEGGAEVSELASGTRKERGWELPWWSVLEKEGGRRGLR